MSIVLIFDDAHELKIFGECSPKIFSSIQVLLNKSFYQKYQVISIGVHKPYAHWPVLAVCNFNLERVSCFEIYLSSGVSFCLDFFMAFS